MNAKGSLSHLVLLASAAVFASAAMAVAQTTPPPPSPPNPGWGHPGDHGPAHQDWRAKRAQMQERRLAELHTKLDLKPVQEPAWLAFVTGLQAARPTPKPHERPDWEELKMETTPERLDHMLAGVDEMRAHLAQMDQVVKTFYAGLSKDQQTIFNDNFQRMGPGHGERGGWAPHGEGRGPMGHGPGGHDWTHGPGMGPSAPPGLTGGSSPPA